MKLINRDFVKKEQRAKDFGFSNNNFSNTAKPVEIKNKQNFAKAVIIVESSKNRLN
jgi:hypothetical protein